jgi:dihydrofolate reductase
MYETMAVWEVDPTLAAQSELMADFAARDFTVGGPTLAAHAFNAALVDECHLFICPVLVGQGKPAFPSDAPAQLELLEEHRFGNGVVYLRYRTQS